MKRVFIVVIVFACLSIGCEKTDNTSPDGAFAGLAPCMDKSDVRCLYFGLDRESHWSVQTIHRTLGEIYELASRSYPENMRQSAYGSWHDEAEAEDPVGVFETYCKRRQCLEKVAIGFGAVVKSVFIDSNTTQIETTRGGRFEMNEAEGRWGLGMFKEELQQAKISLLDRLNQVKRNAAEFDEQRLAGVELK
jgi:hypothetical protein